jgi:hypothetical protein
VAEFSAEDFLRSLGQIRFGFKRPEERQIPTLAALFRNSSADELQGWPELVFRELINQVVQFLAHRAHN